jgi:hypothetical protein
VRELTEELADAVRLDDRGGRMSIVAGDRDGVPGDRRRPVELDGEVRRATSGAQRQVAPVRPAPGAVAELLGTGGEGELVRRDPRRHRPGQLHRAAGWGSRSCARGGSSMRPCEDPRQATAPTYWRSRRPSTWPLERTTSSRWTRDGGSGLARAIGAKKAARLVSAIRPACPRKNSPRGPRARHTPLAPTIEVPLELPHQKLATPNAEQLLRGEQLLFDKTDPMPVYLMPPI